MEACLRVETAREKACRDVVIIWIRIQKPTKPRFHPGNHELHARRDTVQPAMPAMTRQNISMAVCGFPIPWNIVTLPYS